MPETEHIPEWTIADRLRKAREDAGLNQTDLAREIGISRASITHWEQGKYVPRRPVLLAWALRCRVPVAWLMTGETPPEASREEISGGLIKVNFFAFAA